MKVLIFFYGVLFVCAINVNAIRTVDASAYYSNEDYYIKECQNHWCKITTAKNDKTKDLTLAEFRKTLPNEFRGKVDCVDWRFVLPELERVLPITTKDLVHVDAEQYIKLKTFIYDQDLETVTVLMSNFYEVDLTEITIHTDEGSYSATINPNMKLDSLRRLLTKEVLCGASSQMKLPEERILETSDGEAWRVTKNKFNKKYQTSIDFGLGIDEEQSVAVKAKLHDLKRARKFGKSGPNFFIFYTNVHARQ